MLLFEPNRTPYDLSWKMFGVNVRVHPMFWLVGAIMGYSTLNLGIPYFLAWMACLFVSILIHEFGHVCAGLLFGSHGHIVLYGFGGLAIGSSNLTNRWKRIAVYFAGPFAGFLYVGVLLLILRLIDPERAAAFVGQILRFIGIDTRYADISIARNPTNMAILYLILINLFYGAMNLLPVYPLDGGQISRDLFNHFMRGAGVRPSLGLSLFVAGLVAINAFAEEYGRPLPIVGSFLPGGIYIALLFTMLAINNYQELQQVRPPTRFDRDEPAAWERDPDYWKR